MVRHGEKSVDNVLIHGLLGHILHPLVELERLME